MAISKTRGGHCYLYLLIFFKYLKKYLEKILHSIKTCYICTIFHKIIKMKHYISTFQHN